MLTDHLSPSPTHATQAEKYRAGLEKRVAALEAAMSEKSTA